MKKGLIITLSVLLIAALIGGVVFIVMSAMSRQKNQTETDAFVTTEAPSEEVAATIYAESYKVGIVQHGLGNASKDCYEGFVTELSERNILNNLEIVYIVEDNEELCREKIKQLVDNGCDLLYTIGRFASEAAAEITTEVPIVFGAVNSPDEVGLVESNEVPGGNVTGVSSYTPCFEQIDLIPLLLPEAKKLATIYTHIDENSVLQGIIAKKEAENIGIKCDEYPIDDKEGLEAALEKIKEAETDVIYIPVDKFLSANISILNEFSYENKIPVICGDEATLELGAFATSEINYSSIGRKAAGMVNDILFLKKDVSTLSVNYKHDCTNIVNKTVKEKLGVSIPATSLGEIDIREFVLPTQAPEEPTKAEEESD